MSRALWPAAKRGLLAVERRAAAGFARVLAAPAVLVPTGAVMTLAFKTKGATDRALATLWSTCGLPTRRDQERLLHQLHMLESRLADLDERLHDEKA